MKKFVALIILVLIVVGGWSAGWFLVAGEARGRIAAMAANDGDTAPQVTCGTLDITGFPFRFDLTCADARLVDGDVTATLAGFKASMLAYNPTQVVFSALSPATYDDAYSGARGRIEFSGAEGSARVVTDDVMQGLTGAGWRIGRISVVAEGLSVIDTLVGDTLELSADRAEAHLLDIPERHDATAGTAVLAAYAGLNNATAPRVNIVGGETSFEAKLSGVPDDVRRFEDAALLCRIRDAGGELKLVSLRGAAADDFFESTGTLRLDANGKPEGQLQLRSRGIVERIEALVPPELRFIFGQRAADGSYAQTLNFSAGIVLAGLMPMPFLFEPLC
jgi:hypothetical protein